MFRKIFAFAIAAALILSVAAAVPPQATETPYDALKHEAERYYAEKSFSRAHAIYEEAAKLDLPPDERRWVRIRLADTAWRAEPDSREGHAEVRKELQAIVDESTHDLVWAEVAASEFVVAATTLFALHTLLDMTRCRAGAFR